MEFIINPSLLKEELGLLTPVIERKASIPVLSKIKMETNASGELALTATDLDVTMRSLQVTDVLPGKSRFVTKKDGTNWVSSARNNFPKCRFASKLACAFRR
jgi:DNA polymerase III sliding clamp (beta) subunit (PCNA family)